jgi:hypothetical protein
MRAGTLVKKARKNGRAEKPMSVPGVKPRTRTAMGRELFALAEHAQRKGWNAEDLLRMESKKRERSLRRVEGRERKTAG